MELCDSHLMVTGGPLLQEGLSPRQKSCSYRLISPKDTRCLLSRVVGTPLRPFDPAHAFTVVLYGSLVTDDGLNIFSTFGRILVMLMSAGVLLMSSNEQQEVLVVCVSACWQPAVSYVACDIFAQGRGIRDATQNKRAVE